MAQKLDILISATNKASGPIGDVKQALGGLGSVAGATIAAAGAASVAAVAGVTAVVAKGVGQAAEMEQRVADIASVMGLAKDQTQPLADLISNLGIDPKLKVDATQAADAIEMLATNGLSMSQILDGAARNTVLLANATGADFATAANVATDTMSLFGIEAKDMKKAVDGITGVTIASKFGMEDYALALSQGGGVAAAAGVEFEDFNATIAAISPYFGSGSDAGTSFKTMLQRIASPTKEAMGAMQELGLATADGKNAFYDANGQMKSMSEIAGMLAKATAGLSEEQKSAALSTIFGSDAIRAAVALAETGSDKFDQLKTSMAGVNSEANAATRMDTFSGQMEILQGILDGLTLQIGQAFLPVLREFANWATDFVSENGDELVAWFKMLSDWLVAAIPVVVNFGKVLFGALGEIGAWVQGQQTNFDNLKTLWKGFSDAVNAGVAAILKYISDKWPEWVATLADWAKAAWQWIAEEGAPKAVKALQDWAADLGQTLQAELPNFLKMLFEWGTQIYKWIGDAVPKAIRALSDFITSFVDKGTSEGGDSFGQMVGKWLHTLIDWIWKDLVPKVGPAFAEFLKVALAALGNIALEFAIMGAKLGVTILTSLAEALLNMVGINISLGDLRTNIFSTLDSWREPLKQKAQEVTKAIGEGIQVAGKWSSDRWTEFMGILHKDLDDGLQAKDFVSIGSNLIKWMIDGVKSMWGSLPEELKNMLSNAWSTVLSTFNFAVWKDISLQIVQGLISGIDEKWQEFLGKLQSLIDGLPQIVKDQLGINSPSKVFEDIGQNIMAGLAQGIAGNSFQPEYAMRGSVDAMTQTTHSVYNTYHVNLSGSGSAQQDVLAAVQLMQMMNA